MANRSVIETAVLRNIDGTYLDRAGLDTKCLSLTFLECKVLKMA